MEGVHERANGKTEIQKSDDDEEETEKYKINPAISFDEDGW